MDEVSSLLLEIQDFTRQRRVRWVSFFRDFDRNNNKRISPHCFKRGLAASKLVLSAAQTQLLADAFADNEGAVNYGAFCDRVEEVFTVKGLERAPQRVVEEVLPRHNRHYASSRNELDEDERRRLDFVLAKIANKVRTECIVLERFFQDYDRHKVGFVSQEQFRRGLCILYNEKEAEHSAIADTLIRAYEDFRGDVNYRRLANDVDKRCIVKPTLGPRVPRVAEAAEAKQVDLEDILDRMRDVLQSQGLNLLHFFVDLDKMHKRSVTRAQFKAAVTAAFKQLHFDSLTLDQLADRYSSTADFTGSKSIEHERVVRYCDFVDEIDRHAAHRRDLHTRPTKLANLEEKVPKAQDTRQDPLLLEQIRRYIDTRRIHLKPVFEDFDRFHRGCINRGQFARVLKQELRQLMLTEDNLEMLCDRFAHGEQVSYLSFIDYVEPARAKDRDRPLGVLAAAARASLGGGSCSAGSSAEEEDQDQDQDQDQTRGPALDREDVLEELQRKTKALRIRLSEFLADADRQKHGLIPVSQLARGLSRARIPLSEGELELLVEPHLLPGDAELSQRSLRWRDLVQEVELAEVTRGLEKMPSHPGVSKVVAAHRVQPSEEDRLVQELLEVISNNVTTNRILLLPAFSIHDKLNSGKLGLSLFRRAIDSLQLKPLRRVSEDMLERLAMRFCDGTGPAGPVINYRAFLAAVDPREFSPDKPSAPARRATKLAAEAPGGDAWGCSGANNNSTGDEQAAGEGDNTEFETILADIKDQAWSRGVRIKPFLECYDRLRKGTIPVPKFTSGVVMSGLVLTSRAIEVLCNEYATAEGVAYLPFVYALDGGDERLEEAPTSTLKSRAPRSFGERYSRNADEAELERILKPMRHTVRLRHLHLLEAFKNFDRKNLKAVTLSQFAAVLKTNGLLPLDGVDEALETLHGAYPARHEEKINYVNFVDDLAK